MYGRENRLKVSRDEAKAAAEQAVLDEKNLKVRLVRSCVQLEEQ